MNTPTCEHTHGDIIVGLKRAFNIPTPTYNPNCPLCIKEVQKEEESKKKLFQFYIKAEQGENTFSQAHIGEWQEVYDSLTDKEKLEPINILVARYIAYRLRRAARRKRYWKEKRGAVWNTPVRQRVSGKNDEEYDEMEDLVEEMEMVLPDLEKGDWARARESYGDCSGPRMAKLRIRIMLLRDMNRERALALEGNKLDNLLLL